MPVSILHCRVSRLFMLLTFWYHLLVKRSPTLQVHFLFFLSLDNLFIPGGFIDTGRRILFFLFPSVPLLLSSVCCSFWPGSWMQCSIWINPLVYTAIFWEPITGSSKKFLTLAFPDLGKKNLHIDISWRVKNKAKPFHFENSSHHLGDARRHSRPHVPFTNDLTAICIFQTICNCVTTDVDFATFNLQSTVLRHA